MSLTNERDKQRVQLAATKASEAELTDGPDQALRILGPPALFESCGSVAPQKIDQAVATIKRLLPDDLRYPALLEVFQQMSANEFADARARLNALRDDSDAVWWQAHAQLCEKEGDHDGAAAAWEQAAELLPHPGILQQCVRASFQRRRFESAILALKRLLANDPDNEEYLNQVVAAFLRLNDFAHAEQYLVRLVAINPTEAQYRFALAQSFARTARPDDGIAVLQPVCDSDDPPPDALFLQSELLDATDRSEEALHLLRSIAADHWDEPQFLLRYCDIWLAPTGRVKSDSHTRRSSGW